MTWHLLLFIVVTVVVGVILALSNGYVEYMGGPSGSMLKRWLLALVIGAVVALVATGIASLF